MKRRTWTAQAGAKEATVAKRARKKKARKKKNANHGKRPHA